MAAKAGEAAISIHAPRVGSDEGVMFTSTLASSFQSTLPVWGATAAPVDVDENVLFQSTLPVWGATWQAHRLQRTMDDFNPRSPCGERQMPLSSHSMM